ncbi:ABC transporter A family member 8-like [Miscanthus floridulus]|uniref:ABC transporter A family member 8-like n=1 Tax=Miscanthus floridulus TaxID=154761 RepID=UPI003459EAB6
MGANCLAQTNALFRKNLVIQRRNHRSNCCLICFPLLICLLLGGVQMIVAIAYYASSAAHRPQTDCGYCTASTNSSSADTVGGLVCPTECPLPIAPKWPPVLQLPPAPDDMDIGSSTSTNLTGASITRAKPPAATFLVTGANRSFSESVMSNTLPKHDELNFAADISTIADFALGTDAVRFISNGAEELGSDFDHRNHLVFLQSSCTQNVTLSFPVQEGRSNFTKDAECIEGLFLWREDSSVINSESYRVYYKEDMQANQIASAYDLTSSDLNKFNLIVSYNSTYKGATQLSLSLSSLSFSPSLLRVPWLLNLREIVEQLLQKSDSSYSVICDNLKKVYHGKDGNAEKIAVTGLSLSMQRGQCFGILGPNGAGKTSLISMLTGFTKPTSGTAYIDGMDIRLDMNKIYTGIGVCPQFDLLWETLTGREHLMFYGRLKNLRGGALDVAVEHSLKSVRLFDDGIADKRVAKYSGGMKRRLSVAISLIGDPKVVYMDEPSSGLDPASRRALWNAVMSAKENRAIILTTHSMEEAEALCDRIGIMVNGSLQCIGNSKELKAKYGGTYVLTITTAAGEEEAVEQLVRSLCPVANRVHRISGTQKFEMPKQGLRISEVFEAMENAKSWLNIAAWGLSDATLEDTFIKVASESDVSSV